MVARKQPPYPNLTKVFRRNFAMVATSVPGERVFSNAGQLINDRKTAETNKVLTVNVFKRAIFNSFTTLILVVLTFLICIM